MNFTIVIVTIILTAMYMMKKYSDFNTRMYDLSIQDDLTGLYNKRYLIKALEQEKKPRRQDWQRVHTVFLGHGQFQKG